MAERDPDDPTGSGSQRRDPDLGPPPHPLDRVWAHPSELGASTLAGSTSVIARRGARGVAFGAVCGAMVTLAIVLAAGGLGDDSPASTALLPAFPELRTTPAAELVAAISSSVVVVRAVAAGDERTGTGIVVGGDRILTNASLVGTDDTVTITMSDGGDAAAELLGRDPETDLAVLRADGSDAPTARMGSADDLTVGTWVLAVGASGSHRRWANEGIVSGLDQVLADPTGRRLAGMLGTDIESTPGVGGGPLLDESGAVVAILSRAVPGYAVPIDTARAVADQLVAAGRAPHGWLGVVVADEEGRDAGGALVESIVPGGPAEIAGLAPGDVIIAIGEHRITDAAGLSSAISRLRPGDPVALSVWRDGKRRKVDASLGTRAPDAVGLAAVPT